MFAVVGDEAVALVPGLEGHGVGALHNLASWVRIALLVETIIDPTEICAKIKWKMFGKIL